MSAHMDVTRQMILGDGEDVKKIIFVSLEGLIIRETGSTQMTIETEAILESVKSVLNVPDFSLDGHNLRGKTTREVLRDVSTSHGVSSENMGAAMTQMEKSIVDFCRNYRARMGEGLDFQPHALSLLQNLSKRDDCILVMISSSPMRVAMMKLVLFNIEGMFSSGGFGCDGETYADIQAKAVDRVFSRFPRMDRDNVKLYSIAPYPAIVAAAKAHNIKPIGVACDSFSQEQLLEAASNCEVHPDLENLESILNGLDFQE